MHSRRTSPRPGPSVAAGSASPMRNCATRPRPDKLRGMAVPTSGRTIAS
jgi:hypothetical protein